MTSLSRLQEPPNSTIGRAEKRVERVLEKYLTKGTTPSPHTVSRDEGVDRGLTPADLHGSTSDPSRWELRQELALCKERIRSLEDKLAVFEGAQAHWLQISAPPVQQMVSLAVRKERHEHADRCRAALQLLQAKDETIEALKARLRSAAGAVHEAEGQAAQADRRAEALEREKQRVEQRAEELSHLLASSRAAEEEAKGLVDLWRAEAEAARRQAEETERALERRIAEAAELSRLTPIALLADKTMYRIKDPKVSLDFYTRVLGMTLLTKLDFKDMEFSLYFLGMADPADIPEDPAKRALWAFSQPGVLELTHSWGTESQDDFKVHNGNSEPKGYGHLGFYVPDVNAACKRFEDLGVPFQKTLDGGKMKGIAFILDPDGYWIEILDKGVAPYLTKWNQESH
ncbi:hypothetical protein QBZ16_000913 [Prototheca wickerhamii]|uniref:Lactoylglutathione lyase n=1 Tax=Prototheca wickerhamii TaxID=3111 RepID=A0AAD9IE54_PROWI|nr:hypothetical protein QBZ16_000913 [Prototheca wickerhamii]